MMQDKTILEVIDAWDEPATGADPIGVSRARPGRLLVTAINETCRCWPGKSAWDPSDSGLVVPRDSCRLIVIPAGVERLFVYVPAGAILNCAQVR